MSSEVPEGWEFISLRDVATIIGGGTPSTKDESNFGGDVPWITPKDLSNHSSREIKSGSRSLSNKGYSASSAKRLPARSVLISSRAPIGYTAIAGCELATNQGFRSLVMNEDQSPEFFYYLISGNRDALERSASGSTFKEISGSTLGGLEFCIPPLSEQRRIAWVLGTLDDKIELNRKIASTLEETAAAIFKARFVDFEGVEEFEDSEIGPMPKGWNVGELGDLLIQHKNSIKADAVSAHSRYVPIDLIDSHSLCLLSAKPASEAKSSLIEFSRGDFLFGAMRPYFHKVCIAPFDGITRTTAFVLRPSQDFDYAFSLMTLNRDATIEYATQNSRGSTIPYADWSTLSTMPVVLPPPEKRSEFNETCLPLLNSIAATFKEVETLTTLRDDLLPKLISGKIRVPEGVGPDLDASDEAAEIAEELAEA